VEKQPPANSISVKRIACGDVVILDSLPLSTVFETDLSKHHLSLLVGNTPSPISGGYPQSGYPIYYCGKLEEPVILPKYPRGNSVDTVAKTNFLDKHEQKNYFSITVDTNYTASVAMSSSLVWPKIDSTYHVNAYLIIAKNRSADKAILMDRAHIFRAILEAKNAKGKWRQIHPVFVIGCGLEANLKGSNMSVNILPPNGVLIAKMILPNGDFEAECRLRYQFYNFTFMSDDPKPKERFWFKTDIEPVFSNTFKLKIFKDQFAESDDYEDFWNYD
jgi:hypothetical protein